MQGKHTGILTPVEIGHSTIAVYSGCEVRDTGVLFLGEELNKPARRWTAKRKMEVVLEGFRGEITPAEIARKYGITQAQYFEWRDQVLAAGLAGLRNGGEDDPRVAMLEEQVKRLQQTVGQLVQEKQILQEALGLGQKRVRK